MAEMTTAQMTEYLKQVAALETSVYKQTKVKESAEKELILPRITKRSVTKPTIKEQYDQYRPYQKSYFSIVWDMLRDIFTDYVLLGYIFTISAGLTLIMASMHISGVVPVNGNFILVDIIMALPILLVLVIGLGKYIIQKKNYASKLEAYYKGKEQHEVAYKAAVEKYQKEEHLASVQYLLTKELAEKNYIKARDNLQQIEAPLLDTEELLMKIYAKDIIFPKYRNMVAMCTMYEYFASGRCTELTGANGAYNLYEAELRQNLIINQLETVNINLEQVKQNQYVLYQGIMETNKALQEISFDVKNVVNATQDIAISNRITAYCSQIIAVNAKAQTYLEIMD